MGTPDFAVPTLEALLRSGDEIVGVVTQPDRPKGRGKTLTPPPISVLCQREGLPVLQPTKMKGPEFLSALQGWNAEVMVVAAFGRILPQVILDMPSRGCMNVHGSLLPKYRGAGPIQWAILNGETETGITIMLLDESEDTGDIILQQRVEINSNETAVTLSERLAHSAPALLVQALEAVPADAPPPHTPQNHAEATHAPRLTKEIGQINWEASATAICNLVRGTAIWPGAYTLFEADQRLKIIECHVYDYPNSGDVPSGTIEITSRRELIVFTGEGALGLDRVQPANKKEMNAHDFLNGYRLKTGDRFLDKLSDH